MQWQLQTYLVGRCSFPIHGQQQKYNRLSWKRWQNHITRMLTMCTINTLIRLPLCQYVDIAISWCLRKSICFLESECPFLAAYHRYKMYTMICPLIGLSRTWYRNRLWSGENCLDLIYKTEVNYIWELTHRWYYTDLLLWLTYTSQIWHTYELVCFKICNTQDHTKHRLLLLSNQRMI